MQHFVNEYEYTRDFIEECVRAWWACKYKAGYRSMSVQIILIAVLAIMMKRPALLLLELAPLFVIMLFTIKKKKSIQLERERVEVLYRNSTALFHIEVGEEIFCTTPNGNSHVNFSDVEGYAKTKNLIVLFIKGNMTLTLDKEGFKEGTKEDFLSLLEEKVR